MTQQNAGRRNCNSSLGFERQHHVVTNSDHSEVGAVFSRRSCVWPLLFSWTQKGYFKSVANSSRFPASKGDPPFAVKMVETRTSI